MGYAVCTCVGTQMPAEEIKSVTRLKKKKRWRAKE